MNVGLIKSSVEQIKKKSLRKETIRACKNLKKAENITYGVGIGSTLTGVTTALLGLAIPTALISVFSLINLYLTDHLSAAGKKIDKLYPNISREAGLNKKADLDKKA